ncbi:MAG TPA: hypothetical protein VJU59_19135 [Paraburkholderia sp.]|uniref:hypothetical protein n=1 Tax=Paraburkholderia sp. TaxID=1926495 RepID=UPI002B4A514D|nr:hypothetical protein [Paraburkholderia sp.]HKR41755.1 hypothetical protein [Paraburkholderia sp.]
MVRPVRYAARIADGGRRELQRRLHRRTRFHLPAHSQTAHEARHRVIEKWLALLREDAVTLNQLAARALPVQPETQEHIWFDASRSRLVRLIGLAAYEAVGGYVRRDLPTDDESTGSIADAELLQRLVAQ